MTPDEINAEMERRLATWLQTKAQAAAPVQKFDMAGNRAGEPPRVMPPSVDRRRSRLRLLHERPRGPRTPPAEETSDPAFVSVRAAARYAGVTPRAVYNWIEEGKLPFRRLPNGRMRVEKAALLQVPAPILCAASSAHV